MCHHHGSRYHYPQHWLGWPSRHYCITQACSHDNESPIRGLVPFYDENRPIQYGNWNMFIFLWFYCGHKYTWHFWNIHDSWHDFYYPHCTFLWGHMTLPQQNTSFSDFQTITVKIIIPPASTKLKGGYTGITLSVCPSVRLWTESCPLCIFNNTHRIHFIFAHLIKQLQKVCRVKCPFQN